MNYVYKSKFHIPVFSHLGVSVGKEKKKMWLLLNFWTPVYILKMHTSIHKCAVSFVKLTKRRVFYLY